VGALEIKQAGLMNKVAAPPAPVAVNTSENKNAGLVNTVLSTPSPASPASSTAVLSVQSRPPAPLAAAPTAPIPKAAPLAPPATASVPVVPTSSPGDAIPNAMSVRCPEDLLGWEVRFHNLVGWTYLNGQPAYVVSRGQHPNDVHVLVSQHMSSTFGCPLHFECAVSNLVPIRRGNPF
jgi:hypothetical protein